MVNRNLVIIASILIVLGLFGGDVLSSNEGRKKVVCDVTVDNDILTNADITNVECSTRSCGLFTTSPLGIISQRFQVVMEIDGQSVNKGISLRNDPLGDERTISISQCVDESANSGTIKVFNEDNILQDTREVSF